MGKNGYERVRTMYLQGSGETLPDGEVNGLLLLVVATTAVTGRV